MDLFMRRACGRVEADSVFRRVEAMIYCKLVARKAESLRSRRRG